MGNNNPPQACTPTPQPLRGSSPYKGSQGAEEADERTAARERARASERIVLRERARSERWAAKPRATVAHPDHGSVTVPHGSKLQALQCAAEIWGVDWLEIRDAEVWGTQFPPRRED